MNAINRLRAAGQLVANVAVVLAIYAHGAIAYAVATIRAKSHKRRTERWDSRRTLSKEI